MKKLLFIISFGTLPFIANAQQDTLWRRGGILSLNLTQVSLTNWAAGGQNSFSGSTLANFFANRAKGKNTWDNSMSIAYGLVSQGKDAKFIKSDDQIDLSSKFGRQATDHWFYSTLLNFRSQFAPGYNYPNDSIAISRFLAPGYVTLATGFDYKPTTHFSLFVSALSARWIIVTDKLLSDAGAYGVDSGKTIKSQFGALLKATLDADIGTNVNLKTTIDLFSDYLKNPQNIVVNWQMLLSLKVNRLISASITTQLIYDDKVDVPVDRNDDGIADGTGKRTQFKEVLGIGFAYKFEGMTVKNKK